MKFSDIYRRVILEADDKQKPAPQVSDIPELNDYCAKS